MTSRTAAIRLRWLIVLACLTSTLAFADGVLTERETSWLAAGVPVLRYAALMLCGTIIFAWLFPLSREKHARIQKMLERRRERRKDRLAKKAPVP